MTVDLPSRAAKARKSHSIASAVRSGITVWYAVLGGIAAWTIHLMVLASIVQFTCNAHGYTWVMHVTTAVTVLMAVAAMLLSARLASGSADEGSDSEGGRDRFLGRLGLVVGAANLLLIGAEEVFVIVLSGRACA